MLMETLLQIQTIRMEASAYANIKEIIQVGLVTFELQSKVACAKVTEHISNQCFQLKLTTGSYPFVDEDS